MTRGIENEAGQKRRTEESDPVVHFFPYVTKRDVRDGGCQSIKQPPSNLEGPKRRCAALERNLGHAPILATGVLHRNRLGV
jgi:hypothetical protein